MMVCLQSIVRLFFNKWLEWMQISSLVCAISVKSIFDNSYHHCISKTQVQKILRDKQSLIIECQRKLYTKIIIKLKQITILLHIYLLYDILQCIEKPGVSLYLRDLQHSLVLFASAA